LSVFRAGIHPGSVSGHGFDISTLSPNGSRFRQDQMRDLVVHSITPSAFTEILQQLHFGWILREREQFAWQRRSRQESVGLSGLESTGIGSGHGFVL
jgi:hypothetical protein